MGKVYDGVIGVAVADSFQDCILKAVNLGEDTDTTAAVAGDWPEFIMALLIFHRSGLCRYQKEII